jgi:hypothetical protein
MTAGQITWSTVVSDLKAASRRAADPRPDRRARRNEVPGQAAAPSGLRGHTSPQLAGHGADHGHAAAPAPGATGWIRWWPRTTPMPAMRSARSSSPASAWAARWAWSWPPCAPTIAAAAVYSMTFEYDGWNMQGWMKGAYLIQAIANLPLHPPDQFRRALSLRPQGRAPARTRGARAGSLHRGLPGPPAVRGAVPDVSPRPAP